MGKTSNAGLKYTILTKNISLDRLFFFEVMKIIQIFLRGLGKLAFDPLNGWVLN